MTPDEFRRHGAEVVEWIARYLETVEQHPVLSQVAPGDVRASLPAHPPQHPEPFEDVLADVDRVILPGITHWQSPNWFAYFPANTSGPSILGELLAAGLGVQGMLWATSPACTELETHVLDWMLELLGLPDRFRSDGPGGGVIEDSASSATLVALLAARQRAVDHGAALGDLVAYASAHTHSSLEKAARVAGLRPDQVRIVDVDEEFAMRPGALAAAVVEDRGAGRVPFFCCATVGTTSSLAVDPVADLVHPGVWLHVDGAMAGSAAVCPELRWVNDGLDRADSYAFNPHKWLFTNFDCTCFWVADRTALLDAVNASGEQALTHTRLDDRLVIRVSIGQTHTEERHVRALWDHLRSLADGLA
jgi:aromatic-L-amino-acid decarboxylase